NPALVFISELPRPGNTGHAKHHGRKVIYTRIVAHVLVGRTLGAAIGRMEVEGLVLGYSAKQWIHGLIACTLRNYRHRLQCAINFIRRGVEQKRPEARLS